MIGNLENSLRFRMDEFFTHSQNRVNELRNKALQLPVSITGKLDLIQNMIRLYHNSDTDKSGLIEEKEMFVDEITERLAEVEHLFEKWKSGERQEEHNLVSVDSTAVKKAMHIAGKMGKYEKKAQEAHQKEYENEHDE